MDVLTMTPLYQSHQSTPTKIITSVFDRGTTIKETGGKPSKELSRDINQYDSQKRLRYNTLFAQTMSMTVPLNTSIHAGDVIEVLVPQIGDQPRGTYERGNVSGYYLIKELSHFYDSMASYTVMKLLRDNSGIDGV